MTRPFKYVRCLTLVIYKTLTIAVLQIKPSLSQEGNAGILDRTKQNERFSPFVTES